MVIVNVTAVTPRTTTPTRFRILCSRASMNQSPTTLCPSPLPAHVLPPHAQGIAFLHSVGLVHADMKPENVALYPPSASSSPSASTTERVNTAPFDLRLIDLGNAVFVAEALPGVTAGTPSYLSPEARKGLPWGPAVDVWAVGCIMYEILTGGRVGAARPGAVFSGSSSAYNGGGVVGGLGGAGVVGREGDCGAVAGDVLAERAGVGSVPGVWVGSGLSASGVMTAVVGLVERLLAEDVDRRPSAEEALKDALFSRA